MLRHTYAYSGVRTPEGCMVYVDDENGVLSHPLPLRLDLANHSPTGFEWGYAGSGPAQLALAILADVLDNAPLALSLHQKFKFEYIAKIPRDDSGGWTIFAAEIREWVEKQLA